MNDLEVLVCNNRSDVGLLTEIHRLRYRVFKDRLDWEVAVSGGMEIDHYDILNPTYLALVNGRRELLGSVRLLSTQGPYMLADTFGILLGDQLAPRSPLIWETSRFCVDTERAESMSGGGLRRATPALLAGMGEWALRHGWTDYVTVTDLLVEKIVRRSGCQIDRITEPMRIGKTKAVACMMPVSEQSLARIREAAGLTGPIIRTDDAPIAASAVRRRA